MHDAIVAHLTRLCHACSRLALLCQASGIIAGCNASSCGHECEATTIQLIQRCLYDYTIGEAYTFHPLSIFTPCGDSKGFRSRYAMRTIAMLPVINFRQLCLPLDMQKPDRCVRDLYAWGLSILPSRSQLASNCACL